MNAPDQIPAPPADLNALLTLTRDPLPASRKTMEPGTMAGVSVPMREISLTNGETVTVYDTSGPYTDPAATIDVRHGLQGVRNAWIEANHPVKIGMFAACPDGDGFKASFSDFKVMHLPDKVRSEWLKNNAE